MKTAIETFDNPATTMLTRTEKQALRRAAAEMGLTVSRALRVAALSLIAEKAPKAKRAA